MKIFPYEKHKVTEQELIDYGEPFFLHGPHKDRPAIIVLGSGFFWKKKSGSAFQVYGTGIDADDTEEMRNILDGRRNGEIYGRWYSKFCPDGEFGFMNYNNVEEVSYEEYFAQIQRFKTPTDGNAGDLL